MKPEVAFTLSAGGAFFLAALATGAWKYKHMLLAASHAAPVYVDVAHKAALLYSFACVLIARLLEASAFSSGVNLVAAGALVACFAAAVFTYVRLGWRNATDNQFRERTFTTTWGMALLVVGEFGGFLVVLAGFLAGAWPSVF